MNASAQIMNRRAGRVTLVDVRGQLALFVCTALATTALGCGAPGGPANCLSVPQVCPSPAPTFSGQAQAIVQTTCQPCHEPGGQEFTKPMQTYAQIRALAPDMLGQLERCLMPLPDGGTPALTMDDKDTLIAWLVCGAMDN